MAVAVACAVIGTEERPAGGGSYREAVLGQPLSLNPLLHPNDPITRDLSRLVHAGLVRVVDGGRIEPDLASGWTTSQDGRSYTFRLRTQAVWHDGRPVTADDVLATLALLQAPGYPGPRELAASWAGVRATALGRDTVRFDLPQPRSAFIEACTVPLLAAHVFGADGTADLTQHPASYVPVGAGPFRVVALDAESATLARHDGYPGQRPLLDAVELRFFPDYPSALQALAAGQVDGLVGVQLPDVDGLPNRSTLALRQAPVHGHQTILYINHRALPLADPGVRKAIALSIQRDALVDGPMRGQAVVAYGPVAASSWAYARDVESVPDLHRAAQLLDAAGWVGEPVRTRAGRPLALRLATAAAARDVEVAEGVARQIRSIGARVELQPTYMPDLYRERLAPGEFDLAIVGVWAGTADPDPSPLWHSSQHQGGFNFGAYQNLRADQLLDLARTIGDPGQRLAALTAFQQLWLDDTPAVVLFSPVLTYAVAVQYRGVRLGTVLEPSDRFQHLTEWYLHTQRVPALTR